MNKKNLIGLITAVFLLSPMMIVAQTSKPAASAASERERLAVELYGETANLFPAAVVEEIVETVRDQAVSQMKTTITATLGAKLDESDKFTPERKEAIKAKLPELAENVAEITRKIFTDGFTVRDWVGTASIKNYQKKFSEAELKELIATFQSSEGQEFVTLFNQTITNGLKENGKSVNLQGNPQVIATFDRFAETRLGKKFFNVLVNNVYADVSEEAKNWSDQSVKKLKSEMDNGSLNRVVMEFVRENLQ